MKLRHGATNHLKHATGLIPVASNDLLRLSFWVLHVFNYCFYGTSHEIVHFWLQMKMSRGVFLVYYSCATVSKILKAILITSYPYFIVVVCDFELNTHLRTLLFLALTIGSRGAKRSRAADCSQFSFIRRGKLL